MQVSVQVQPHIVDIALKYLSFCNSAQALGGDTASSKGQGQSDNTLANPGYPNPAHPSPDIHI